MLLISFNKCSAQNVTEAKRPFMTVLRGNFYTYSNTKTTASAVSFNAILSCKILDFG